MVSGCASVRACTRVCEYVRGHTHLGGSGSRGKQGESATSQILLLLMHCVTSANSTTFLEPRFPLAIKYGVNCPSQGS